MSYPMHVDTVGYTHAGGTKAYFIICIVNNDEQVLLIKRWGKVNAFGEVKTELLKGPKGVQEFQRAMKERVRRGYKEDYFRSYDCNTLDELIKAVGRPTWMKMTAADITHLEPQANVAGVRERDDPAYDEDGNFKGRPQPRKVEITPEMEAAYEAQKAAEKRAEFERMKQANPIFGRF